MVTPVLRGLSVSVVASAACGSSAGASSVAVSAGVASAAASSAGASAAGPPPQRGPRRRPPPRPAGAPPRRSRGLGSRPAASAAAAASTVAAGGSPAGISPLSFFSAICPSCMARPPISAFSARTRPVMRRGDHADELAVEHVAGGQARERSDLLGVERLAVHQPPLNASSSVSRRKVGSALAASAASPRTNVSAVGPSSSAFSALGARLVGGALGERVLDDAEGRVGVAQPACAARPPGHGDAAVVDGEDRLGLLICSAISAIAAAFCSRFMRPPIPDFRAPSGGAAGGLGWPRRGLRQRRGRRSLLEDVTGAAAGRSSRPGPSSRPG